MHINANQEIQSLFTDLMIRSMNLKTGIELGEVKEISDAKKLISAYNRILINLAEDNPDLKEVLNNCS